MRRELRALGARALQCIAPLRERRCAACALPVPAAFAAGGPPLCDACGKDLARRTGGYCPRCGDLTAADDLPPASCGVCLTTGRPWDALFFHGEYQGLLRALILRLKRGRELSLAAMLGHFLAAHPAITGPYDALVPLPLHPRRLRERGFNQAAELAKPLAKRLGAPLDHAALRRLVVTRPQAGLSPKDRKRNVRDVFQASCSVAGRRLLIVDDIATTCASLEAAATALRNAGAASVDAAVVARTSGNK